MAFKHFKRSEVGCLLLSDLIDTFGGEGYGRDIIGNLNNDDHGGSITHEDFTLLMT